MMKNPIALLAAASLATVLGAATASATTYPASLSGLTFNLRQNDTMSPLVIQSQGTAGNCPQILGTFAGSDQVAGYYCPATGEMSFLRISNNITMQVFFGNVVFLSNGVNMETTGTFATFNDGINSDVPFDGLYAPPN